MRDLKFESQMESSHHHHASLFFLLDFFFKIILSSCSWPQNYSVDSPKLACMDFLYDLDGRLKIAQSTPGLNQTLNTKSLKARGCGRTFQSLVT